MANLKRDCDGCKKKLLSPPAFAWCQYRDTPPMHYCNMFEPLVRRKSIYESAVEDYLANYKLCGVS